MGRYIFIAEMMGLSHTFNLLGSNILPFKADSTLSNSMSALPSGTFLSIDILLQKNVSNRSLHLVILAISLVEKTLP